MATAYLFLKNRNYFITLAPGIFMLYMVILYLLTEQIGFGLEMNISYWISAGLTIAILIAFGYRMKQMQKDLNPNDDLINDQKPIGELYPDLVNQ